MIKPASDVTAHALAPRLAVPLRPPNDVMRLSRFGAFHQSRLSFMRVLLRRIKQQNWTFDRPIWRINDAGVGVATYKAMGPEHCYTLIVFSHDLPAEKRSDRVIAEAWDATFTLFDGEPTEDDLNRLSTNVPLQEAGRLSEQELILSRANRSVRLFEYVVDTLSKGDQPDPAVLEPIGYLMRTTAVYGSGKFGAADREKWADRPEFLGSFQPELLSVWLIRSFTVDLVEHLAKVKAPDTATGLGKTLKQSLGVGNSTGLGMAPFLINHPALIHTWISARETAIARVRSQQSASVESIEHFHTLLARSLLNAQHWQTTHEGQAEKVIELCSDLEKLQQYLTNQPVAGDLPWNRLFTWCENNLATEAVEQVASLMLEPFPELVDDLAATMLVQEDHEFRIDGTMSLQTLATVLQQHYSWALETDFSEPRANARVWYVSEEKLEPRLGERHEEPIEPYEQALAPGRDAAALFKSLSQWTEKHRSIDQTEEPTLEQRSVAGFLLKHPEHRHMVRRVQLISRYPYGEIRDNTIAADMLPIDLLRCKLSFFGATRFDPRSDRWVRITMFKGAPFPKELQTHDPDDMAYPPDPNHTHLVQS